MAHWFEEGRRDEIVSVVDERLEGWFRGVDGPSVAAEQGEPPGDDEDTLVRCWYHLDR
jgi:hypothetical protein